MNEIVTVVKTIYIKSYGKNQELIRKNREKTFSYIKDNPSKHNTIYAMPMIFFSHLSLNF